MTGSVCIRSSLIRLCLQPCFGELELVVTLGDSRLCFDFLGVCRHLRVSLSTRHIAGCLRTGNLGLFLHELFLLDADGFDNTVVMTLPVNSIADVLHIEGYDLKTHFRKVRASVLNDAQRHLLAVRQNLVNGHVRDNLAQVSLQNIVYFIVDALLVHSKEIRDSCLLAGHDVRFRILQTGCLDFLVQNSRVFTVDLNRDNRINPERYAVLGFNACLRSLDIDFQKAHVQTVRTLQYREYKCSFAANDFRSGKTKTRYYDCLRRRGFLVAEKAKEDEQYDDYSNDECHDVSFRFQVWLLFRCRNIIVNPVIHIENV